MSRMYFILAMSGWIWLAVVLLLIPLLVRRRRRRDGIEVVEADEKQS